MADMIRRDTAIDELERIRNRLWEIDIPSPTVPEYIEHHEQVQSVMKAVTESVDRIWKEPAQPERIRGRWISADAIFGGVPFYCSECGENTRDTVMGKPRWNFCPNCGADMRGEQDV